MISGRAVLWCLLLGVLVMLLVRMPGVRLYDYLATRWRGGQTDEPAAEAHAAEASTASANPAPGRQVRQPG
ncbi:hypothetical protein [Achromobacter sp. DH1f]|uniref:hypothetical protein n=1 Tax=Achromobacter sp. DH1f TaxID=1397275 RepID=UPI00046ABD6A|nr:hypothetical protein [Achromobacter sp. DH1f]